MLGWIAGCSEAGFSAPRACQQPWCVRDAGGRRKENKTRQNLAPSAEQGARELVGRPKKSVQRAAARGENLVRNAQPQKPKTHPVQSIRIPLRHRPLVIKLAAPTTSSESFNCAGGFNGGKITELGCEM